MDIKYEEFGFYHIDIQYLKYLHSIDSEIYYTEEKAYDHKPFIGILLLIGKYKYFIPLTSGKTKHSKWKNVDKSHYLIYEVVSRNELQRGDIYKKYSEDMVLKILAALDIKKMIPVPESLYSKVDFFEELDEKYKNLLEKEYWFCKNIRDGILDKAQKIYFEQKNDRQGT